VQPRFVRSLAVTINTNGTYTYSVPRNARTAITADAGSGHCGIAQHGLVFADADSEATAYLYRSFPQVVLQSSHASYFGYHNSSSAIDGYALSQADATPVDPRGPLTIVASTGGNR
jgi:hypothetical protein